METTTIKGQAAWEVSSSSFRKGEQPTFSEETVIVAETLIFPLIYLLCFTFVAYCLALFMTVAMHRAMSLQSRALGSKATGRLFDHLLLALFASLVVFADHVSASMRSFAALDGIRASSFAKIQVSNTEWDELVEKGRDLYCKFSGKLDAVPQSPFENLEDAKKSGWNHLRDHRRRAPLTAPSLRQNMGPALNSWSLDVTSASNGKFCAFVHSLPYKHSNPDIGRVSLEVGNNDLLGLISYRTVD